MNTKLKALITVRRENGVPLAPLFLAWSEEPIMHVAITIDDNSFELGPGPPSRSDITGSPLPGNWEFRDDDRVFIYSGFILTSGLDEHLIDFQVTDAKNNIKRVTHTIRKNSKGQWEEHGSETSQG